MFNSLTLSFLIVSRSEPFDAIMEGFFTLVDIQLPPQGLVSSGDIVYSEVIASFCQLSWTFQQNDPKTVPLFENIKQRSMLCEKTMVSADLFHIARLAQEYDAGTHKFAATKKPKGFQVVPPTAVIFHQSHAGSTLTGSILAVSDPQHAHVYSQAPAADVALTACDGGGDSDVHRHCDDGAQEKLIQDVFYLMGRMNRPTHPQHVFYNVGAQSVRSIDKFRRALPTVPWIFLFRNSVEVMASQMQGYDSSSSSSSLLLPTDDKSVPSCLRDRYNQWQHPTLVQVVASHNRTVSSLTAEEYCAAHLASLAQSAITENQVTSSIWADHLFVNYNDLPFILWDRIIPKLNYMTQPISLRIDVMHDTSRYYFTGEANAAPRLGQLWQEDNGRKQAAATDAMKNAAHVFMDPLYAQMDAIRVRQVV